VVSFISGIVGHLAVIIWTILCNNITVFLLYQLFDAITSRYIYYDISCEFIS